MDKVYQPNDFEEKIYQLWEKQRHFCPDVNKKLKPFTIVLPPPNANAPLHMGHAMYVVEDILCRYHRMLGEPTLFLPGTDHAGIETQYVFEKKLKEEGKSRFDFDRETLYRMIWNFVEKNRGIAKEQMKRLGFSLDWTRELYTLEPIVIKTVLKTFKKLYHDGLIYRGERIVNYCTFCGTAFSELEVNHVEKDEFLYFLDYGPVQVATTRPETIFADVAIAVNPQDSRFKKIIGQMATIPLINKKIPVVADKLVQIDFGTGALKITPAHDPVDFEIGQKHHLPSLSCISLEGRMINVPEKLANLYPKQAKEKTIEWLKKEQKLIKIEPLHHTLGICYKCKNPIEPLLMPQWFIKIGPLAQPAIEAVNKSKVKIFPPRFKKLYLDWMKNIRDWNISRQIIWGPRIPAWYCLDCNQNIKINFINKEKKPVSGLYKELKDKYSYQEIKDGLQGLTAPVASVYEVEESKKCSKCHGSNLLQETDTFDTWFSSGQWPLATLGINIDDLSKSSPDFKYFYPTSVLDTMWDILFFWVARMIMFGLYLAKDVPFKVAHMHSRVVDVERKKMSKSKGNVINPIEMVDKYGADALRMALVFGNAPASDIVVTEEKIKAMRNFANKIWNAARFTLAQINTDSKQIHTDAIGANPLSNPRKSENKDDQWILSELDKTIKSVAKNLDSYHFGQASETLYNFTWHTFCDKYLEMAKPRLNQSSIISHQSSKSAICTLFSVLSTSLQLLHPFMPFITEAIWQMLPNKKEPLIISKWPVVGSEK